MAVPADPLNHPSVDELLGLLEEFRQAAARSKQTMHEMATRVEQQQQMLAENNRIIADLRTELALTKKAIAPDA